MPRGRVNIQGEYISKGERNSKGRAIIKGERENIEENIYTGGAQINEGYKDLEAQADKQF